VITLPLLQFEVSECKKRNDFQSLIVVKVRTLVASGKHMVLQCSKVFALKKHTGDFLLDCVLTPLLENSSKQVIAMGLPKVVTGLFI
jgi:hypothetical protein